MDRQTKIGISTDRYKSNTYTDRDICIDNGTNSQTEAKTYRQSQTDIYIERERKTVTDTGGDTDKGTKMDSNAHTNTDTHIHKYSHRLRHRPIPRL